MSKAIQRITTLLHKALFLVAGAVLLTACQAKPEGKRYSVYAYNYTDYSIGDISHNNKLIGPSFVDKAVHEELTLEATGEKVIKNYSWAGSWCCRTYPPLTPDLIIPIELEALRGGRIPIKTWAYVADFTPGVDSNVTLHIYPDWHVEIDGTAMGTAEARPPIYKPDSAHASVIGTLIPWEKNDGQ